MLTSYLIFLVTDFRQSVHKNLLNITKIKSSSEFFRIIKMDILSTFFLNKWYHANFLVFSDYVTKSTQLKIRQDLGKALTDWNGE
ncbi:hypothetical protein BpHYR1_038093 [Brachionus plicatilis]|uniref:Uncharacterized protein n=1 Tax=Brachionus plicatilis TaxID=10195 RepID=A0A3M7Q356_BRAPC|nr:hypothetical protein BpHYR1_038093 [Brachionus plicatilis]